MATPDMSYFYESLARIDAKLAAEELAAKATPRPPRTRRGAEVVVLAEWKAARATTTGRRTGGL